MFPTLRQFLNVIPGQLFLLRWYQSSHPAVFATVSLTFTWTESVWIRPALKVSLAKLVTGQSTFLLGDQKGFCTGGWLTLSWLQVLQRVRFRQQAATSGRLPWRSIVFPHNPLLHPEPLKVRKHNFSQLPSSTPGVFPGTFAGVSGRTEADLESFRISQNFFRSRTERHSLKAAAGGTCIHVSSLSDRSSLGEYHKDSRNLKRLKDSSECTFDLENSRRAVGILCLCLCLASSSDTIPTAQAHPTERGGFSERVAQNAARHRLLHHRREHLHRKFTPVFISFIPL